MASSTRAGSARRPHRAERGYTLVVLMGMVAMILIAVAAALPHWRAVVQREKEAELVTRGFQYAEAIRVFQLRFGRLPTQLSELVELEPRSIRKLWDDPMSGGPFLLVMEGPDGALVSIDPETGELVVPPVEGGEEGEGGEAAPRGFTGGVRSFASGGQAAVVAGPIHGVKSRARGEAYRVLFDQKDFGDWEFTVERLVAATSATGPDGLVRRVDYTTIGKPFRYPPPGGIAGQNLQPQGGRGPGQRPNRPRRPGAQPPGQPDPQPPAFEELPEEEEEGKEG